MLKKTWDLIISNYKAASIAVLAFIIPITPRIPLGTIGYGKRLDLRYEDLLLLALLVMLTINMVRKKEKLKSSTLYKPMIIYLLAGLVSTIWGILMHWIQPLRGAFFNLKEAEYFLFFLVTLNFLNKKKDIKVVVTAFLATSLLNGLYGIYQLVTRNLGALHPDAGGKIYYYGITLLGEYGAMNTAAYYAMILSLALATYICFGNPKIKLTSIIFILIGIFGLLGSMVKSALLGLIITVISLAYFHARRIKKPSDAFKAILALLLIIIPIVLIYQSFLSNAEATRRITDLQHMIPYYLARYDEVFKPLVHLIPRSPFIGLGKSITGTCLNGFQLPLEAHNHFLRVLVEMGIAGFAVFIWLLCSVINLAYRIFKKSTSPAGKATGLAVLLYLGWLLPSCIAQDALIMAKPTALLWIFVGLLGVIQRWNDNASA